MSYPANRARFQLTLAGVSTELRVLGFRGREALSGLFQFEVETVCKGVLPDLTSLLKHDAVLEINGEPGRLIHGTVAGVSLGAKTGDFLHYHLTLVPRLHWLGLRHNFRVFRDLAIPDIVRQLLKDAGFEPAFYRFDLSREYHPRALTVQYDESDLHFLERLLQQEGIHYHIEHTPESHVLVMGDHPGVFRFRDALRIDFRNDAAGMAGSVGIQEFSVRRAVAIEGLTLNDYHFPRPQQSLQAQSRYETFNRLTHYQWPGGYENSGQGARYAQDQLDARRLRAQESGGSSNCEDMIPGSIFRLRNHPCADYNDEYLLTAVEHQGEQPQVLEQYAGSDGSHYGNRFSVIPASQVFRPPLRLEKPLARSQTAVVVGPEGEQVYTDEFGRVKVRFLWDREGRHSCWLRLSQSSAGNFWGAVTIPRVGQEVLVEFVDGDPDRPLVMGCLYHGLHRPPYPLPEHKSRTLLRSQSLGGSDGHELMLEDAAEQEKISVHSSGNLDIHVARDVLTTVDRDSQSLVTGDRFQEVKGSAHLSVTSERRTHIAGQDSLTIDKDLHLKAGQAIHQQAGQELHFKAGMRIVVEAATAIHLKAGAGSIVLDAGGVHINGPMIGLNGGGGGGAAVAASPVLPLVAKALALDASGRDMQHRKEPQPPAVPELYFKRLDRLPEPQALVRSEILALAAEEKVLGTICQRQADGTCLRGDCACNPANV